MISLLLSGFIGMFNETALNVALSDLINLFHISAATAQWLTTGYLLTLGILVPISGLLLQWFSTRQLFMASLIFSVLGTLVAALAPGFEMLMTARVIQAAGIALMLPLMFNTVLIIIPAEKRGGAYGLIGLVLVVAPAIAPTISGLLIDKLSWNWIFWLSLPILVIALLFGMRSMQNVSTITKPKIDIFSLVISTLGFGGIVFAFSSAGEGGWGTTKVVISMIVGILALIIFVGRQLRMKQPMMDLRAFKHPMFTVGTLMIFITMMVMLSAMLVLPMYLIRGLGLSAFTAGLVMLPGGIINAIMLPIMGRVFDKFGPKWVVPSGLIIITVVLWFLSGISTATALALIIVLHSCLMIGISMVWMPSQANGLNQLPPELYPHGSAIMNTLQQLAGAIGTAVAVSIMTAGMNSFMKDVADKADPANGPLALIAGIQNAFIFAIIVAIVGLFFAFFIKRVHVGKQE
ncbi:DHA2 family efflux MFS transporter permease subunit [Paenibacillus dokdonensis]|uniref:DHA2 family efflux MFS transporter permease subunit n=1 Tax=Paenibacillus dokdonensis TaxID=2567944 RepID=A0ABU6GJE3_9BACL|nr:DHA2 family efflux MFS transporter permease subunit [Paenibacillus dokdonensis]MEC0239859.1 DHA2 family efflux MFS transporter permease subunit [Paenibacillus dokdonensis]